MDRQDFINAAGIGYIQGTLLGLLDLNEVEHKVKIDGMFGTNTIEGLELAIKTAWRVPLPPFVDTRVISCAEDYSSGIEVFQKWYKHTRDYLIKHHPNKAKIWSVGETDGIWNDRTNAMFLIVIAPFSL